MHLRCRLVRDQGSSGKPGTRTDVTVIRNGILDDAESSAAYSDCGKHRYVLSRRWDDNAGTVLFVMLNPSTATESRNDPTISRCHGFAIRMNGGRHGAYTICNLFSLITPDRKLLESECDRLDETENDQTLLKACQRSERLICAWGGSGADGFVRKRARAVVDVVQSAFSGKLECLGTNRNGAPSHPLYLRADIQPRAWYHGAYLQGQCRESGGIGP